MIDTRSTNNHKTDKDRRFRYVDKIMLLDELRILIKFKHDFFLKDILNY